MAGLGGDIPGTKAVVSIEPSVPALPKPVGTTPPILAVLGQCDEQIPLADNRKEVRDLIAFAPKAPVVSVLLQHATHIDMVTGGGSHTIGPVMPDQSPACAQARCSSLTFSVPRALSSSATSSSRRSGV